MHYGIIFLLMKNLTIQVQKLHKEAKIPKFAHSDDAGMDLYVTEEIIIASGEYAAVSTGIAMAIPEGYAGLIWDKSGLAIKKGLKVLGGVIDAGYRGEIKVGITNLGKEAHTFGVGDKAAQMLLQKVAQASFEEVESLDETERGDGGFGSTGK